MKYIVSDVLLEAARDKIKDVMRGIQVYDGIPKKEQVELINQLAESIEIISPSISTIDGGFTPYKECQCQCKKSEENPNAAR